jgi:hypothetical protein
LVENVKQIARGWKYGGLERGENKDQQQKADERPKTAQQENGTPQR